MNCLNNLNLPWIAVSDRLPKHTLRCLIKEKSGYISIAEFNNADSIFIADAADSWDPLDDYCSPLEEVEYWLPIYTEEEDK